MVDMFVLHNLPSAANRGDLVMPYRAGFWIRVLATAFDVIAMLCIAGGVVAAINALLAVTSFRLIGNGLAATVYLVWLAYTSMEVWTAATPGKMVLRMRVCSLDCTPADFWRRFLRWSTKWSWLFLSFLFLLTELPPLYALSGFISLIVLVGCLFAANEDRLTWHDQWAQTAVCYMPRRYQSFDAIVPPPLPPTQPPPTA